MCFEGCFETVRAGKQCGLHEHMLFSVRRCTSGEWLQGGSPSIQDALDLHFILSKSDTQLRQPVGLEEQLLTDSRLDSVVGMSMLQLLQVQPPHSPYSALHRCCTSLHNFALSSIAMHSQRHDYQSVLYDKITYLLHGNV